MASKNKGKKPALDADGDDDKKAPEQQEKDAVKKLLSRIERAKTLSKYFHETTLPKLRKYQWGTYKPTSDEVTARTNLIYATSATMLPHIYAKNPEISVAPTEAVDDGEYDKIKKFGKTSQVALNHVLIDEAKMKRRIKSAVRSTMATSVGWLKLTFQHSLMGDPLMVRRANDLQDNIRRAESLIAQANKETDTTTLNQQKEELTEQLETIMQGDEIKLFKGFVIDRINSEDVLLLDESIKEFDEYVNSKAIAHRVWMDDDDYRDAFGKKPGKSATAYGYPASQEVQGDDGRPIEMGAAADLKRVFRAVWEVWNKTTNTICVVCEGCEDYCKEPYRLEHAPERWYSFYCLGFNVVEGRWRPLSDTELLMHLQEEYNTTRFLFAEARKEAIPLRIYRKGGELTPKDIEKLTKRKARDWIGIEGNPAIPLDKDLMQLEGVVIDPAAYDVTIIRNDMDMMVGLSDASRANLIQAKTATEAEIMRQALMTRVAERQDHVEDVISEMALSTLQTMLQGFTKSEMEQIVGAGAQWPESANLDQIFRQVRVSVKAGTSGKPNVLKERETWATIMPIINETMTQVAEMRMAGQDDLAEAKIELLKETLQRYDERIDVDRFVPRGDRAKQGTEQAKRAQQLQQLQVQLQQVGEEYKKCQQDLQQCQMDLKIAKSQEQAKLAEVQAKQAIDAAQVASKEAELQRQAEIKKAAELEAVQLKQQADDDRNNNEYASKAYAVAVSAAATIITQRLQPVTTKGADGSTKQEKGEDLTAEQIAKDMRTIVEGIVTASPL